MENDSTLLFDKDELIDNNIKQTLKQICTDLQERGYNPIKQITGYLISGDPGYISSYKECRNRIILLDRDLIIEMALKGYLK